MKAKPRATIIAGEKCGVCDCNLRQISDTEKLNEVEVSRDSVVRSGGFDVSDKMKSVINCLANVTWHVCGGCHLVIKKRTEPACPAKFKWAKNISLSSIRREIASFKAESLRQMNRKRRAQGVLDAN
jgi:hypothetical protein